MSLTLSKSNNVDCKSFSGFAGRGFLENEIRVGDNYINIEDFNELVLYYLTNTDLEANDKRLELLEKIKKLHQVDGWNKENKRLELKDSFADSLFSLFEDLNKKDFQHICRKCNKTFYGTKGQSHCDNCLFEEENRRLQKMIDKSEEFKKSMEISDEKLNREFNL